MESKSKKSLVVVIPMFNEEAHAKKCVQDVINVIRSINRPIMLLVINDGSSDKTLTLLKGEQKKYKKYIVVESLAKNRGYGGALQIGIKSAIKHNFTYALFMDSDLTNNPKYIKDFIRQIPKDYDCVKASRFIKGGKMVGVPPYRQLFSRLGNFTASVLFGIGIHDCTNGFRMIKLSTLKNIRFRENKFAIILEELYYLKKKHAKFYEIPTILTSRKTTNSHFTYSFPTLWSYLKYALKAASL